MKDTKFKDWQAFLDHQAKRGLSQNVIELVKTIRLQVTRQFKLDTQQINLQSEKITFHLLAANQRGKVFLNIHLREDLLRLLLINDGVSIPIIAEKIQGVKDYPNLHKIELKQRNDFNTDVILAIMDSFKAATNLAAAPPKPKVNGVPTEHINEKALNQTTNKSTPSKEDQKSTPTKTKKPKSSKEEQKPTPTKTKKPKSSKEEQKPTPTKAKKPKSSKEEQKPTPTKAKKPTPSKEQQKSTPTKAKKPTSSKEEQKSTPTKAKKPTPSKEQQKSTPTKTKNKLPQQSSKTPFIEQPPSLPTRSGRTRAIIKSANDYSIADLLHTEKDIVYYVPKYQRAYVWEEENWKALLNDLLECDAGHFLGLIICINQKTDSQEPDTLELVDGQQRITTVSILFTALYSYFKNKKKKQFEEIISNLKHRLVLKSNPKTLRLQPALSGNNLEDYDCLIGQKIGILPGREISKDANRRRFFRAYRFFQAQLATLTETQVKELVEKASAAILVKIEVSSYAGAFTLFETLNNRGVPLDAMDLIKNRFLDELEKSKVGSVNDNASKWNQMIENLGIPKIQERFLRHYYNIYKEELPVSLSRNNRSARFNLIETYDQLIKKGGEPFFHRLLESAQVYSNLIYSFREANSEVLQNSLKDLQQVKGVATYMLLLYVWEKFRLTESQKTKLIALLVTFFIRRNVTNYPSTGKLDRIFIELIEKLGKKKRYDFSLIDSHLRAKEHFATNELFKEKLAGNIYLNNRGMTRFILCKLEESQSNRENQINYWEKDSQNQYIWTIEHVLPQRDPPPASWIEMIAKGNKQQAQDIQKAYAHTIGNLTLTGYNPRLGDKPFPEKRDKKDAKGNFIGFKNGLFLNKYLQAQTTWNKEKIKKRSDYLIDKLMKLFG